MIYRTDLLTRICRSAIFRFRRRMPGSRKAPPATVPVPRPRAPEPDDGWGVPASMMTLLDVRAAMARPYAARAGTHRRSGQ